MRSGKTIFICAALVVSVSFTVGALACEAEPGYVAAPDYVMPGAYPLATSYSDTDSRTYCREFQTEAMIGGEAHTLYGTACRRPDGSWALVAGGPFAQSSPINEQHAALQR